MDVVSYLIMRKYRAVYERYTEDPKIENLEGLEEVVNFIADRKHGQLDVLNYTNRQVGVL
jgi:hypothetical protein